MQPLLGCQGATREGYVGHSDVAAIGARQPDCVRGCDLRFRHQHVRDERRIDVPAADEEALGLPSDVDKAFCDAVEASFLAFEGEVFMRPFHAPNVKLLRR